MKTNKDTMETIDLENKEMQSAYNLIAKTNQSFFLTGRAGTGKTTFLRAVQREVKKNFVVLAPSGVAAIQAGGQTIHSFFGLGFGVQGPKDMGQMNANKIVLVQHLDTIIIDEVSMVRCDLIDAMDRMLRDCRHSSLPFGGVQMVFVGDMFQLLPIATPQDQPLLRHIYGTDDFFFYKARCLQGVTLPKIEFRKIYRQNDEDFIKLLEHFRIGQVTPKDLNRINSHVITPFTKKDEGDMRITLTAYRGDAQMINERRLADLPGESFTYEATYEGNANRLKDIVDNELVLRKDAQVMFLRNDTSGRWANGTIGKVVNLDKDDIFVQIGNDPDNVVPVEKQTWEAFDYHYDEEEKKCKKEVVGSVTQYPLRLAWAITIHKSQSLTFDKVEIDFGRGAFTPGQAYVALSRSRSLKGINLVSPIDYSSIRVSKEVQAFAATYNDEDVISTELAVGEAVREYEKSGDFDGAACRLFEMCADAARKGQSAFACDLLNRALSYVADDACLFRQEWETLPNTSRNNIVLNAAGLLYAGKSDESIGLLTSVVSAETEYFNGMYLLARALELKEDWPMVETLYKQMSDYYGEKYGYGLDSPSFRKFKYRMALLNERQFGNVGFELIAKLIAENPSYDRYYADLRWMLQKRLNEIARMPDDSNPLAQLMLNPEVTEEQFLKELRAERKKKSDGWKAYRVWVSRLKAVRKEEEDLS